MSDNPEKAAKLAKRKTFGHIQTRPALGSGAYSSLNTVASNRALEGAMIVQIEQLIPNFLQVRQHFDDAALGELAEDIKARGILEPLLVREQTNEPGTYEIIAGERRYRAAQLAGLKEVPVIIREMNDKEARFAMLAENLQRQNLDPRDEQRFLQTLQNEYNLSVKDIAALINRSIGYVSDMINGKYTTLKPEKISKIEILGNFSQSTKVISAYNSKVYERISQFWDNALEVVKAKPDSHTIEQIRENLADAKKKLSALEAELTTLARISEEEEKN